jgi:NADPH:quinone reductase-like Zn-dependent oxidoreductase
VHAAAGGVGTALVQLCKRRGCVVYGTASSQKMDYLRRIGVDWPIDYLRADFAAVLRMLRGGDGLDVIFDSIGGATVRQGMALLAAGGRIVCLGAAAHAPRRLQMLSTLRFAASFGFQHPIRLMLASKAIIGVNMLRIADNKPVVLQRCLEAVVDLTRKGALEPTVGGRYPAEQIAAAHAYLEGRASTGKVVVTWA